MNLEREVGGRSLRFWGLVLNLIGNVLLLHGAVRYLMNGAPIHEMLVGAVITAACLVVLSLPGE